MASIERTPAVEVLYPDSPDRWRAALPARRSVFGSLEFASLLQDHHGYRPLLFTFRQGEAKIAYPLLLRGFYDLPFQAGPVQGWDTRTPEYTGPIPQGEVGAAEARSFRRHFRAFCRELNLVAEFAHLHPWINWRPLLEEGAAFDRELVYVDLTQPVERLWEQSFNHACRKNIQRARRENVRVFPARSLDDLREFHRIYLETMERNAAAPSYFFPLDYFTRIFFDLPENAIFLLAEHQDRIVAGTLYLHDDENVYSYLGGADHACQQVRPTNAVIYEAICWGRRLGKRRLILGGGYRPDDGIFRFKATFSPLRADFYTYRRIHQEALYDSLCDAWASHFNRQQAASGYFPQYRAVPAGAKESGSRA